MTDHPVPPAPSPPSLPEDDLPPYEPPAIILERRIEAVATACAFDPPLTKSNAGEGCTGMTFS